MIAFSRIGVAAALAMGCVSIATLTQAQVVDGTGGRVSRCDMFKALGKALPPECGGTAPSTGGATRGRVVIGAPAAAPAPALAPVAAPTAAPRPGVVAPVATTAPAAAPAPAATTTAAPKGLGLPVPFALDSDELTPDAMKVVDALAEVFKANAGDRFVIEGHTDASGDPAHNRALSERRARAVVAYLAARHGLPEDRFVARGQGNTQLLLPADPFNGRNRRVQVMNVGS